MNNLLMNMKIINKYIFQRKVIWTRHCLNRLSQRDISILDIKTAISNGNIIERYYDDYPYQSCLILGRDNKKRNIHIVCGINNESVYIITAYYPENDKWEKDMKTRR